MDNIQKYFKMPGGLKRFKKDNFIVSDLSRLNIRQVIKLKHLAHQNLKTYDEMFSNWKKRLQYQRYMKALIHEAHKLQQERRKQAVEYYYSLPKEERTPKNWIKYTRFFANQKNDQQKTN